MMTDDDPRHGTNAGYQAGCRQYCCREASRKRRAEARKQNILHRGPTMIPSVGSVRRLQALMAIGWRQEDIARAGGWKSKQCIQGVFRYPVVRPETARRIDEVFRALCMKPGPSQNIREYASRKGYVPPLAWDDIDRDPAPVETKPRGYYPKFDKVPDPMIVRAVLEGARPAAGISLVDRREVVKKLAQRGMTGAQIATWLGVSQEVVSQDIRRSAA